MFHRVFCESEEELSARELAEWIIESAALDEEPRFEPPFDEMNAGWRPFEVVCQDAKRPIQFMSSVGLDCEFYVAAAIELLHDRGYSDSQLAERLRRSKQVFVIEFDEARATEDVWELLDVIETRLARERDGIILSPDEGFFDGYNKPIRSFQ